jgi:low affinity Fe/Cu permease
MSEDVMRAALPIGIHVSGTHRRATTWFSRMSNATASWTGKPSAFALAAIVVVVWAVTGPFFHYSDTWQLVINTGTTIVTFLMVFLIQNTQNRDTMAIQAKLSELIIAMKDADNAVAVIEDASDEELEEAHKRLKSKARTTRA